MAAGLLLLLFGAFQPAQAEGQDMEINVNTDYGNLRLGWEEIPGADSYRITMLDESDNELVSYTESGSGSDCLDQLAWYCQENGFPVSVRFHVQALQADTLLSEGVTDKMDPRDFFPEQEQLRWDEDVDPALVTMFSWDTSGDTAEGNNHISVYRSGREIMMSADYYDSSSKHHETEKKISEAEWQELLNLLRQGSIVRRYVSDPEISMLDGSDAKMIVRWENMSDTQERFYAFSPGESGDALLKWLFDHSKKSMGAFWIAGAAAAAVVAGEIFARKKKK